MNEPQQRESSGEQGRSHAQIVLGVALTLLGEPVKADPAIAQTITDEVKKVIAATAQEKPAWLGPPNPGLVEIDYSRFSAPRLLHPLRRTAPLLSRRGLAASHPLPNG